jgi:hypothetical protein
MLERDGGGMTFENQHVRLQVGPDSAMASMTLKESFEEELSLKHVAEMVVILQGVVETLPFLLA